MRRLRERIAKDERGFTLPEALVAMVMMVTVLFALYSIFDTSLRIFSYGNDKIEAVENARIGLERMEREIRAAYPTDDGALLDEQQPGRITFDNKTGDASSDIEEITYRLNAGENTLLRNGDPVVENVGDVDEDGEALTFTYLTADGVETSNEPDMARVQITLEIAVDGDPPRTQTLTTEVHLRNRSG